MGAVVYAMKVTQRDANEKCVTDQSAYCDANIETLEVRAREAITVLLVSTVATLKLGLSPLSCLRRLE